MTDINFKDWDKKNKDAIIHPYYNDGYGRYDLSVADIVQGLKDAGYDLDGDNSGNWWQDDDLSQVINYRLEIITSNGNVFYDKNTSTSLSARLYYNNKDITNTVPEANFKWTRISGNTEENKLEDAEWNLRFSKGAKTIYITNHDINRRALFQCQYVKYNEEVQWVKSVYDTYMNLTNKEDE